MSLQPAGAPPDTVTRLVCASISRIEGSVMDELLDIRNRLGAADRPAPVKYALLYASGWFVLWLEGEASAVEAARERAACDRRNLGQTVIHRSTGAPFLTEPFELVSTQSTESTAVAGRRIRRLGEEHEFREPRALWYRLSAPCTAAGQADAGSLPDHHIGLISAEDNGPIDVLRSIGERFGSRVVYQRFAGARRYSTDVGVAYVDLRFAGEVRRVQLLSRRALAHRMVRGSLCRLNSLVMLLGHRPEAAIELARSVSDCVEDLPAKPRMYLFNATGTMASAISSVLARGRAGAAEVVQLGVPGIADFLMQPRGA